MRQKSLQAAKVKEPFIYYTTLEAIVKYLAFKVTGFRVNQAGIRQEQADGNL